MRSRESPSGSTGDKPRAASRPRATCFPVPFGYHKEMLPVRRFALLAALCASQFLAAETKPPSEADIEKRVDAILEKMTLDEKIDYIGGVDEMFIRGYPQYGIPRLKMSDGPLGVRTWGPPRPIRPASPLPPPGIPLW